MTDLDRPILGLDVECKIETAQHELDAHYWQELKELQVASARPTDANQMLASQPSIPKRPMKLLSVIENYAIALFECEAKFYPNDPRLDHWLIN